MFLIPQCQTLPCRARTEAGGGWGGQQREQTHRKTAARSNVQMRIAAKTLEGAFKCVMVNVLEVLGVNVRFSRSSQTADMRSTCGRSFTTLFLFMSEADHYFHIIYTVLVFHIQQWLASHFLSWHHMAGASFGFICGDPSHKDNHTQAAAALPSLMMNTGYFGRHASHGGHRKHCMLKVHYKKRETSAPFVISQGVWTARTVPFWTYFLKGGASKKSKQQGFYWKETNYCKKSLKVWIKLWIKSVLKWDLKRSRFCSGACSSIVLALIPPCRWH